ncbi:MAG: sulfatase [Alphaproteobacteria bacterium]
MARQPNFIVFMTDQHRADHLGCYGHRVLRTPAIDALAARGARFDNFHVASPVCMPNRASFMTGRLPSLHGVRHNGIPLSTEHVTFVELLAAAGYVTALTGKAHLQNFTGAPPRVSYRPPPGKAPPPEALREADRRQRRGPAYEAENDRLWREGNHGVALPFYGFAHADICTGHGDQVGGAYRRWLADRHPAPNTLTGPANALPDPTRTAPQAWRTKVPEDLYPTAYVEDRAADFLRAHAAKDADTPFFLQVSFPDPHHPFTPPGHYWDLYDPKDVTLPANFATGDLPALRHMRAQLADGTAVRDTPTLPFAVTEDEARVILALTYGMITMIDDAVGRLVALVDALGLGEDTVLIFTSDHGDYMADHGLMTKYLLHYHSLIRVPFIIADPQGPSEAVRNDLGSTIDIAPTILARAGLAPFNGMQGRDLFDADTPAPVSLLIEEDSPVPMYGEATAQRVRTLVTERWRLSHHQGPDWWELYDLHADPDENVNLWGRTEARDVAVSLMRDMIGRMTALQDTSPLPTGRA